ncbi:MAG: amino acid adenylation domain-containing protein [Deltaproteobacteria bacterium]|nr:amino acid adenylation domain-containing protein [Deltaproteobacteria bacterium]
MKSSTRTPGNDGATKLSGGNTGRGAYGTVRDYPLDRPIHLFIEAQAAKTPNHTAVSFEDISLTYNEFNRRANRLAHYLRSLGVKKETLVGVYMERSIEMVVALHGIVKAGGAYVPIDPDYPDDRIAFMAQDADIEILLTMEKVVDKYPGNSKQIVRMDNAADMAGVELCSCENPAPVATADSLCYMIYTSGSTGRPKGVPNIHRALVNRLFWQQEVLNIGEEDVCIQKTPYSFDVSVWEFFWPFMFGARLVVAKPGGHKDANYLADLIVKKSVTTIHFVPSMLSLFLTSEKLNSQTPLKRVICSGEALPFELTRRFFEKLPNTELHNLYGPTEAAIDVTHWKCLKESPDNVVPIGFPIANIQLFILDEALNPVPFGETGELHIGGIGLARGYWKREALSSERFIKNPLENEESDRLYKTGDLARFREDGSIEFLGRIDFQVKIRGLRIELQEIEAVLMKHDSIKEAAIVATDDSFAEKQLVAFLVPTNPNEKSTVDNLRTFLLEWLPDYMVPTRFVYLDKMPLSPNGKIDRKSLHFGEDDRPELSAMYVAPKHPNEKILCKIWGELLRLNKVGIHDNFFELGANSLLIVTAATRIAEAFKVELPEVKLFQHPTVADLSTFLQESENGETDFVNDAMERAARLQAKRGRENFGLDGIAVIGMAGRFPGANNTEMLWDNICNSIESITRFSKDELDSCIDPDILNHPNYVPTRGIIEDADKFDAKFFGISPLEAKSMDPQQRLMLELSWAALENAGYSPDNFRGHIGVFAGVGDNHYYHRNVLCHPEVVQNVGHTMVGYGNEKDYIATRVSYHLDLTGPSMSANTGCSTSLLAVDNAFRSLKELECDMAIAGGVDIYVPQKSGQVYREGGTFTRDGHCRPFDAKATGTMFCDGAGLVVLRRLEDAIADGDTIYAVMRGSARNNDGARKVSFLAPSVDGQARVIALAHAHANVHPEDIGYHEAHGTGTPLGDPIEIEALTRAFGARTTKKEYCHLSSIKGNIGHPTIASGVAGFIKAALALYHEKIPPVMHYESPNPKIDFAQTPFKIVTELTPWPRNEKPRIASVSSFGFGGTNVHSILQEAPIQDASGPSRPLQLLRVSGKSKAAIDRNRSELAHFFKQNSNINLADAAFTLDQGRSHHRFRDFVVCGAVSEAAKKLSKPKSGFRALETMAPDVVFMFPGQGAQYVNMGKSLYQSEPVFTEALDTCCELLKPHMDRDLKSILFPDTGREAAAAELLKNTAYTQPAIFTIEYSLAKLWMHLGIQPSAMIGHSIGEFVCATLSGVFSLDDALKLVALRGRLMGALPQGAMLSVRAGAKDIENRLPEGIGLAASNSPELCVVAGPVMQIDAFADELKKEGLTTTRLHTSHAFHSEMMNPIVQPFTDAVENVPRNKPELPFVSTCTGDWITYEDAVAAAYWARHLRMPVRFSEAISKMLTGDDRVFLEIGPRNVLAVLSRRHMDNSQRHRVMSSLGETQENDQEWQAFLSAIGEMWCNGVTVDASRFYALEKRKRIPLPTYQFERKSYWLKPVTSTQHIQPPTEEMEDSGVDLPGLNDPEYTPEQRYLVGLWKELLGVDSMSIDDDFFDLGGHSLVGITLLDKINIRYQTQFILSDIINKPTIREFALELSRMNVNVTFKETAHKTTEEEWTPVVALSSKGSKKPIFCVAGHGGHVMELHHLAKAFAPNIPFYGLETRGVAGHKPLETIEEIAADHIKGLKKVQPFGPYNIAGYSFGGTIAFEMVQQLTAQNETVGWFGLLDAQSPTLPLRSRLDFRRVWAKRIIRDPRRFLSGVIERRFLQSEVKLNEQYDLVARATDLAEKRYNPVPYNGNAFLFRVPKGELLLGEDFSYTIDPFEGWRDLIKGELRVVPVQGGHLTLVREIENASYLGRQMLESLQNVYSGK